MLTLHRESRTIVTDENFSVKLKWVNPACYMDAVPGDVGLGLDISVNEYTRTEFGNPERFEKYVSGQDWKFTNVSIRFSGFMLISGTLVITNATKETYSGWLQSELGVLGTALRDKFINGLAWPVDNDFQNKTEYIPGTDDYACIPLKNFTFWDGKGSEVYNKINYTDEISGEGLKIESVTRLSKRFHELFDSIVNTLNGDGTIDIDGKPAVEDDWVSVEGEACVISPFLFLGYLTKKLLKTCGFFIDETNNVLATDDLLKQLLVYNNFNIQKVSFGTKWEEKQTWDPEKNKNITVGVYPVTDYFISVGLFDYKYLVPKISIKDYVLALQNWLNIIFIFRNNKTVQIIDRNTLPNASVYSLDSYFLGSWTIGERKDTTLKFLVAYDKNDTYYSDWHDLSDRRDDFKDQVMNKVSLYAIPSPQLGELRLVTSENKIYEYKWDTFTKTDPDLGETQTDVLDWIVASVGPQHFYYGDSDEIEEIKTECSTLRFEEGYLSTKHHGNMTSSLRLWSDFSLRLLNYDLAATDNATLEFDGENGLFQTRWKKWSDFWKNRVAVYGEFSVPMNELYYIINHITQPYRTREGKFLIEEMECDFQGDRIGNLKIKGYKL